VRFPFRTPIPFLSRGLTAGVLAVCHLVAACGVPLPMPVVRKDASRPYPCLDRPCGCGTYEECWAGDCCCFTLAEKVAWAQANGIVPPVAVAEPAGEPEVVCEHCRPKPKPEPCPQCEKPIAAVTDELRWVTPAFVQKCHGKHADGLAHLPPAVLLQPVPTTRMPDSEPFRQPTSVRPAARSDAPASPPPRAA
jgi:hypothetical protein